MRYRNLETGRPGAALLRGRLQPVPEGEDRRHQRARRPAPGLRPRRHRARVLHALGQGHRLRRARPRPRRELRPRLGRRRPTASRGSSCSARRGSRWWPAPATSTSTPTRRRPRRSTTPTSVSPTHRPTTGRTSTPTCTRTPTSRSRGTLTLTLGASGDLFDETGTTPGDIALPGVPPDEPVPVEPPPVLGEKNQFNPKVGMTWSLQSGTTLRGAWFRTLKRTLITDQTLEPTQVAGFNQFFDDAERDRSRTSGARPSTRSSARRRSLAPSTRRGTSRSPRPCSSSPADAASRGGEDGHEDLARVYLFAAPHPLADLGAEYQYEKFERDPELFLLVQQGEDAPGAALRAVLPPVRASAPSSARRTSSRRASS